MRVQRGPRRSRCEASLEHQRHRGTHRVHGRTLADLARYSYEHGYDLRHFMTTLSAPASSRLVLGRTSRDVAGSTRYIETPQTWERLAEGD
jgi:hypothetical protein